MGHVSEHHAVLLRQEIAAELQDHCPGDGHQDSGEQRAPQRGKPKRAEILNDLLTSRETRANQEAHKG